jgi:LacI family transcriptional regulator
MNKRAAARRGAFGSVVQQQAYFTARIGHSMYTKQTMDEETKRERRSARPGIRAVAESVKLSPSTVSLALRGSASIPAETRTRVLRAAEALNYVHKPRHTSGHTAQRQIAFVMDDHGDRPVMSNPFFGEILAGAETACAARHDTLNFCVLRASEDGAPLPSALTRAELDGVLLVGPYPPATIARVRSAIDAPIVLVDNDHVGVDCDSVMADDFAGGYLITQHLIESGRRQIVPLLRTMENGLVLSFLERHRGYLAACADHNLAPMEALYFPRALYGPSLAAWMTKQFGKLPECDAIMSVNDTFAVLAMQALQQMGKRIPGHVAVTGYDDLMVARESIPALTTIHNHPRDMGVVGVQRVAARRSGDTGPSQHIRLGISLVVRDSTSIATS